MFNLNTFCKIRGPPEIMLLILIGTRHCPIHSNPFFDIISKHPYFRVFLVFHGFHSMRHDFKDDLKLDYSIVRVGALYLVFEVAISPNNVIPCSVPRVLYRFISAL